MFDRLCEEFDIYQSVYLNWLVIVLPNMYPTLFGLFKAQYAMLDKSYWTPLSEELSAFHPAVDILRTICDKTTPTEKLLITYQTFATVDQCLKISWNIICSMDLRIPPVRAVRMVIHWFSHWDNLEREIFLSTWDNLEEIDPHLSTEQQATIDSYVCNCNEAATIV
uniref:Uncharacterized protein n=1 Tax=Trichobilharzia regenti TaxID=157069 RepID=A0AA85KHD0_TRIRE|nr:unnamed protein product [Trichobilharzia regenti]